MFLMHFLLDLIKVYQSEHLNPDGGPQQLLNKVQFDIQHYFCRRGNEKIEEMTKDTFKLDYNTTTKIAFVRKVVDEQTKNHQETNSHIVTGFMPQIIDPSTGRPHRLCPVRSFENYLSRLNPKVHRLWQQPLKRMPTARDVTWYKAVPLGHTPLEKFMSKLSTQCNLDDYYTNHCIRVTGTTNLFRAHFTPKQIMSVTGHKSLQSLAIYQRVASDEKLMMGMSLMYNLLKPEEVYRVRLLHPDKENQAPPQLNEAQPIPAIAPPPQLVPDDIPGASLPRENVPMCANNNDNTVPLQEALVPYNQQPQENENPLADIDFLDFMNDSNEDEMIMAANQVEKFLTSNQVQKTLTTTSTTVVKKNSPKLPPPTTFTNCTFGNIGTLNIHVHKY